MLILALLEILMIVQSRGVSNEIIWTPLNNNPGFLPFHMGKAKIESKKHVFIHYYELGKIHEVIEKLKYQAYKFSKHTTSTESKYTHQFLLYNQNLATNLESIVNKEKNIVDGISRRYRKIESSDVNNLLKSVTGYLDIVDAVEYIQFISLLKRKASRKRQLDLAVSWNNPVLKIYNTTMSRVTENTEKIRKRINDTINNINMTLIQTNEFMKIKAVFQALRENCIILLKFLTIVENDVFYYSRQYVSRSLLSVVNLLYISETLISLYQPESLLFVNKTDVEEFHNILEYGSYCTRDNMVVFATSLPILHRNLFSLYQIYPIPTYKNTVLIPPRPFLAMSDNLYQYMDHECKKFNGVYFCQESILLDGDVRPDCAHRITQKRNSLLYVPSFCVYTAFVSRKEIWQQLDEGRYIFASTSYTTVITICDGKIQLYLGGTYLVTIPQGCRVYSASNVIDNLRDNRRGSPVLMESFILTNITIKNQDRPLILEDAPLELIFYVNEFLDKMKVVSLLTSNVCTNLYLLVVFLGFLVLFRFLYCFTKIIQIKSFFYKTTTMIAKERLLPSWKN